MIVAPRGAYFFHILIFYYFHRASRTIVFIEARFNPAPVNHIKKIWSVWTTTKAYAPYMDVRRDDYIKDTCSSESYGLKPYMI